MQFSAAGVVVADGLGRLVTAEPPATTMGGALSNFFQDGRALLSSGHSRGVSDQTRKNIRIVFDALRANPRVTVQRLDGLLSQVRRIKYLNQKNWLLFIRRQKNQTT